jgi:hypothetical protein
MSQGSLTTLRLTSTLLGSDAVFVPVISARAKLQELLQVVYSVGRAVGS